MSFASCNIFTLHPGQMEAFIAFQRDTFLPLLQQQPGFLALEVVQTGPDTGVATLWWTSEEARKSASPSLVSWVEAHLEPFIHTLDNPAGPVVLSSRPDTPFPLPPHITL